MRTTLNTEDLRPGTTYRLLTASIVPRPIAWLSTVSTSGIRNLAPYSFFTVASSVPPIISVTSLGHKDSYRNIIESREFVVNIGSTDLIPQINQSSAPYSADIDEFEMVGLTPEASATVGAPRVKEAKVALECSLFDTVEVGNGSLILGRVQAFSLDDAVYAEDGLPEVELLQPPSRLGRDEWGLTPPTISQQRPEL